MTTSTRILVFALMLLSVLAATAAWAQSGGGFDAHVNVFDAGGGQASGGDYVLQSAAGQPAAGGSGAGAYSLNAGIITGGEAADSASPSPTSTAVPSPGAHQRYLPHLAKDGVN